VVHDIAVADMRVDGGIGPAIGVGRDLSSRGRGERHLPPIWRTRRNPAHNVAQPFGREKILPDADWHARIGRGERARIVREYERHALTQACTVPILWYNRFVPTTTTVKGQDLADVWLDH
jgi:hypothetical protein